jgi:hypothetical protein
MMNNTNFSPGDDGTGQMNKSQVTFIRLLEPYEDLSKTVHPSIASLHYSSSGSMPRVASLFLPLLTARPRVRSIPSVFHHHAGLFTVKGLVGTKVLRIFECWYRTIGHDIVQNRFHLSDVMTVGSGYDDGERGTSVVHQEVPLRSPFFSPIRRIGSDGLLCERSFRHCAIHALPVPGNPLQIAMIRQTGLPECKE